LKGGKRGEREPRREDRDRDRDRTGHKRLAKSSLLGPWQRALFSARGIELSSRPVAGRAGTRDESGQRCEQWMAAKGNARYSHMYTRTHAAVLVLW
jgi:hypothetical protein